MSKNLHITDDLLVKYMLGEALPDENNQVNQWLKDDENNRVYFQQFKTIWEQSKELAVMIPLDEKAAWQRFKQRVELKPAEITKTTPVISCNRLMQMAAAVLILSVGSWLVYQSLSKPADVVMAQIETLSNTAIDTLPDGSIITVNKNTKLTYPEKFSGNTRKITLKGEAFFKVHPDKSKPFIITANDVTVTVVGTEFNVKNYDSATEVIVESGIVKVAHNKKTITLQKGERVLINNSSNELQKSDVKDSMYNYYRTHAIVCNNTLLPDVIAVINEAYNAKIILGDAALNQLQLSTTFRDEDLETIVTIIQQTFDLQVTREAGSIVLHLKK